MLFRPVNVMWQVMLESVFVTVQNIKEMPCFCLFFTSCVKSMLLTTNSNDIEKIHSLANCNETRGTKV